MSTIATLIHLHKDSPDPAVIEIETLIKSSFTERQKGRTTLSKLLLYFETTPDNNIWKPTLLHRQHTHFLNTRRSLLHSQVCTAPRTKLPFEVEHSLTAIENQYPKTADAGACLEPDS